MTWQIGVDLIGSEPNDHNTAKAIPLLEPLQKAKAADRSSKVRAATLPLSMAVRTLLWILASS